MVKVTWDYSALASSYHKRAPYSSLLIEKVINKAGLTESSVVCDMGAGTGFLAREFAKRKISVNAVEPNQLMRAHGKLACQPWTNISWFVGMAESNCQHDHSADLISFGSSFNVVNQNLALQESKRICRPGGWLLLLWNHRNLTQGLQAEIEGYIINQIPGYQYGSRRQNHTDFLVNTGLFSSVKSYQQQFVFEQTQDDIIEAWHSHATLQRQAGPKYAAILKGIEGLIRKQDNQTLFTPYHTHAWLAKFK